MNAILVFLILLLCKAVLSDHKSQQEELLKRMKRQDEDLANCDKCGLSFDSSQKVPVIINGANVASSQKYPWMVALIQTGTTRPFCGGAIISRNFILTAGHCIRDMEKMDLANKNQNGTSKGKSRSPMNLEGMMRKTDEVTIGFLTPGWYTGVKPSTEAADLYVHPEYDMSWGKTHDIALIKLKHPITCNSHANPICLPPQNVDLPPDSLVTITGYGQQDGFDNTPAKELMEAVIQARPKQECADMMGYSLEDLDNLYCLKGYKGETPCFGDSGGTMFSKLYGKKYVTVGVASAQSSETCDPVANVVYTSVASHLPWIHQVMAGDGNGAGKDKASKQMGNFDDESDSKGSGRTSSTQKTRRKKGCKKNE